ncbi:MAG: low molecular weight phosphotyrosine protein phosphatase [Piscirickettsiaceae bacterium]|nr:low molecular weight phosphotyrosine protein phosphatase [Piscirickettsiaceae bacterium]
MNQIKILFVCMGNICRSPTAEGVFNKLLDDLGITKQFLIDSAGTHNYHVGKSPDVRSQQTAHKRGIHLSNIRARKVSSLDFDKFDYILAMDADNYNHLLESSHNRYHHKIHLFLKFAHNCKKNNVPDPYSGDQNGFERVFDLIEDASRGFYKAITKQA